MQKVCLIALFIFSQLSLSAGTLAQFHTPLGAIEVELFDEDKPVTVRNFIRYVESGAYTNMFFHRWSPNFVIQGGGFSVANRGATNTRFTSIQTFGNITNEYNVGPHYSNVYGTIAMAKLGGNPHSASSQWFFNVADNSANLDNQNGGFTVFGRVVKGTNVLNRFKNPVATDGIYRVNAGGALNELPTLVPATNATYEDLLYVDISLRTPRLGGKTLLMTATNSTGAGFTNGSFLLVLASGTNTTFRLVPLNGGVAAASGSYADTYLIATNVAVNLASNFSATLTFTTPTSGRFTSTNQTGGAQSGTFILAKSPPDFSADGLGDLLLQQTNSALATWVMNGTNFLRGSLVGKEKPPVGWRVRGLGDFDGDGNTDILLQQDSTRKLAVWLMHGTSYVRSVLLRNGAAPGAGWQVVGVADFNDDGKPDVLFQSDTRKMAVWLMNRTDFVNAVLLRGGTPVGTGWQSVGTGDFDGDDQTDILFHHTDGRTAVWYFAGTDYIGATILRNTGFVPASGWRVCAVSDINHDGSTDVLWQQTDGSVTAWCFARTNFLKSIVLRKAAGWQIVGPK